MKRFKKILTSLFLSVALLLSTSVFPVQAAANEIILETLIVTETGYVEVYGYIEGVNKADVQVSFLLIEGTNWNTLNSSNASNVIAYIDQQGTSNNGSFLFKCQLNERYLGKTLTLGMNHSGGDSTTLLKETINPEDDGVLLRNIANNDVIYGLDAYQLTSPQLTARNVADSLTYGGNKIYYKLGNNWYDLLDERATDNSFLVSSNKTAFTTMQTLDLRYYYKGNERLDFED